MTSLLAEVGPEDLGCLLPPPPESSPRGLFSNQPAIDAPHSPKTADPGNRQQMKQGFWLALEVWTLRPLYYCFCFASRTP